MTDIYVLGNANVVRSQAKTKIGGKMNFMNRCPRTFTATINGGGQVKSQAQQLQKLVICRFRRFATGQKFKKVCYFVADFFYNKVYFFARIIILYI